MKIVLQSSLFNWTLVCIGFLLYFYLGYHLERSQFSVLLLSVLILFGVNYFFVKNNFFSISELFGLALLFRFILLLVVPNLSQDFYRFIWDGRMLLNGFNPYLTTPKSFIEQGIYPIAESKFLFEGMGMLNASHYTNYPPISQLSYLIAAVFGSKSALVSVVVLRLQIILADIGVFYLGKKILEHLGLPIKSIFLYLLNPFIILELTSNLHFEAIMVFFLVWSLYLLFKNKWVLSAIALGLSISVKLMPLIFLPLFVGFFIQEKISLTSLFSKQNRGLLFRYIGFSIIVLLTVFITFAPFISSELISNFGASIGLWFQNFEFNASIYYIIRWIGFQVVGWNIIGTVGKILPLIVILMVLIISLFRKNYEKQILVTSMLFSICGYLLLSTTIHPWYLSIPLILLVFSNYRFIWVWTFTVFFSYASYRLPEFDEHLGWVALEYAIVISVFLYESIKMKSIAK